jgi:hypothetical protein
MVGEQPLALALEHPPVVPDPDDPMKRTCACGGRYGAHARAPYGCADCPCTAFTEG